MSKYSTIQEKKNEIKWNEINFIVKWWTIKAYCASDSQLIIEKCEIPVKAIQRTNACKFYACVWNFSKISFKQITNTYYYKNGSFTFVSSWIFFRKLILMKRITRFWIRNKTKASPLNKPIPTKTPPLHRHTKTKIQKPHLKP